VSANSHVVGSQKMATFDDMELQRNVEPLQRSLDMQGVRP
jgi:hypothetical protein